MGTFAGISGKKAIIKFARLGYVVARQRGSHVRLIDPTGHRGKITIPLHKELGIGLLKRLIKDAKITPDDFLQL